MEESVVYQEILLAGLTKGEAKGGSIDFTMLSKISFKDFSAFADT